MLGTYTIPEVDVNVAATFQSTPGPVITANYIDTNAQIQPSLGPAAVGRCAPTRRSTWSSRATIYGDRVNQFDLRFWQDRSASAAAARR